ncbi:MAG: AAA family ATPase [Candidatus Pacebacteria bacterium]|nr:AAA family ATPase [Candidatus Paceibacterota bacterium]
MTKKTIIGIIGTVGSGKDTAAEYISKKINIPTFQISQPLKDIAKNKNIKATRENLIEIGSNLVKEKGPAFLAELCLVKISEDRGIITGIRMLDIIDYFKKHTNFILLSIFADSDLRFRRSIERNKLGEAKTIEEFIKNEEKENSAPNAQRLFECLNLADYVIKNNSDIEDFRKEIDLFLEKFNLYTN